ncbi:MAG: hypothetical protein KGD57_09760, partial [Candidatus Lokiarchaeota archaeon]|nr:hypothetical protein [Candidatus Lokiarchaeota archaeon]
WEHEPIEWFTYYWNEFVEWFLIAPLVAQILVIIGIFTLIALSIVLVYYIAKGVYLLLKFVGKGIYKLFKGLSTAVQGKSKQTEQSQQPNYVHPVNINTVHQTAPQITNITTKSPGKARFCSECGVIFSEKVLNTLNSRGFAFCQQCGNKDEINPVQISI